MIWVIGDIHGMIQPLLILLDAINNYDKNVEKTDKLIFLGDYCDIGIHSKEVLDTLIELETPSIFLAGNHDDLFIRFFRMIPVYERTSLTVWLQNGGLETMNSLLTDPEQRKTLYDIKGHSYRDEELAERIQKVRPEEKYVRFYDNLTYSHKEVFDCGYAQVAFRFLHSLPRIDQPLDDQMVKSFDDFLTYMSTPFPHIHFYDLEGDQQFNEIKEVKRDNIYSPEHTMLWSRFFSFRYAYDGDVVVHGHTPTIGFDAEFTRSSKVAKPFKPFFSNYDEYSRLPFLFSRGKKAGYTKISDISEQNGVSVFDCGKHGAVETIDVDTGSVCKFGALTALGLSENTLKKGELPLLSVYSRPSYEPQRKNDHAKQFELSIPESEDAVFRVIKTGRFGADMADVKHNRPFPFEELKNPDLPEY